MARYHAPGEQQRGPAQGERRSNAKQFKHNDTKKSVNFKESIEVIVCIEVWYWEGMNFAKRCQRLHSVALVYKRQ